MRVGRKELFNIEEVKAVINKFQDKKVKAEETVAKYDTEIAELEKKLDEAITKEILGEGTQLDVDNIRARLDNLAVLKQIEADRLQKINRLLHERLLEIIPTVSKQMDKDFVAYNNTVEYELFKRLDEIRQEQELTLLLLAGARSEVLLDLFELDQICNEYGFTDYVKNRSDNAFVDNNLNNICRTFPQFQKPLLTVARVSNIENVLSTNRAEANADCNEAQRELLPQPKTMEDIDLQKFLKGLKVKDNE